MLPEKLVLSHMAEETLPPRPQLLDWLRATMNLEGAALADLQDASQLWEF